MPSTAKIVRGEPLCAFSRQMCFFRGIFKIQDGRQNLRNRQFPDSFPIDSDSEAYKWHLHNFPGGYPVFVKSLFRKRSLFAENKRKKQIKQTKINKFFSPPSALARRLRKNRDRKEMRPILENPPPPLPEKTPPDELPFSIYDFRLMNNNDMQRCTDGVRIPNAYM